jgi:Septum formation
MVMPRGRWSRLAHVTAACAASALLASCFGGSDVAPSPSGPSTSVAGDRTDTQEQPSATPTPDPDPPPKVGACRRVSIAGLRTIVNDDRPVRCRRPHTVVTFSVGELPRSVTRGATAASDSGVERAADRICRSEFRDEVGGDRTIRRLSMLTPTYFLPSSEQFELGARWVRCDAYAYATPDRLADMPRNIVGALDREIVQQRFSRCSPVSPSDAQFRHVACFVPHQWRAIDTRQLGPPDEAYPGRTTMQDRARAQCEDVVRDYLGTDESFSFGFEVPQREAWEGGDRLSLCWVETSQ